MKWLHQLGIVVCVYGLILPLGGCGDGGDDTPAGPPSVNVTGKWTGTSTDAFGSVRWKSYITLTLTQQASGLVAGTVKVSTERPTSGLVTDDHLMLTVDYGNGFSGIYNMDVDGDTMSGTFAESQWQNGQHKDVIVHLVSP